MRELSFRSQVKEEFQEDGSHQLYQMLLRQRSRKMRTGNWLMDLATRESLVTLTRAILVEQSLTEGLPGRMRVETGDSEFR